MACPSKPSLSSSPTAPLVPVDRNTLRWLAQTLHILANHIEINLLNRPEEQQPEPVASESPLSQD